MVDRSPGERECRVLVVEDNIADAFRVQEALKAQDQGAFRTTVVGRLGDAVPRIREADVVLLDLTLPDGSGVEFIDLIRAKAPTVPVVVLSGRRDGAIASDCLQHGAQDVLLKGTVDGGGLARALRCALERHALAEERDDALRRTRALEESFRNMLSAAREGVVVADPLGRTLFANPAAEELLGWPAGRGRDRPANLPLMSPGPSEVERRGPDGEVRTLEVRVARTTWEGSPAVLATLHDLTPRKRAEGARKRQEERAREAEWLGVLDRLSGGVAHGLNNQLTVVLGNASLMMEGPDATEGVRALAHRVEEAGWRATDLVTQLLACAGRQPNRPTTLDLGEAVAEHRGMVEGFLRTGMSLRWEIEAGLPRVRIDRHLLGQVLPILVEFARDSMPEGGELSVRVHRARPRPAREGGTTEAAPPMVALAVSDSGPGLGSEARRRLFEPFYTTDVLGLGSGLGLAPVFGIARQCGGTVEVDSVHGRGTTLRLLLPGVEDDAPEEVEEVEADPVPVDLPGDDLPRGDEAVLVVESDPASLSMIRRTLQALGYRVLGFTKAVDAVRLVSSWKGPMGVLVAEQAAEGLSGPVLARVLRCRLPSLPAILLGVPDGTDRVGAGGKEGFHLLPRPFGGKELAGLVRRVIDAGRAGKGPGAGSSN